MTRNTVPPCRVTLERLSAYLDGDLPASQCRTIQRHAESCPRCAELLDELREATGLCRHAGERPLPPAVKKLAREHIRRLIG